MCIFGLHWLGGCGFLLLAAAVEAVAGPVGAEILRVTQFAWLQVTESAVMDMPARAAAITPTQPLTKEVKRGLWRVASCMRS